MNYKLFGRTGIYISPLILGCMMFGQKTNYKDSAAIIDKSIDLGINFLDTANVYGNGASEEFVGKALRENKKRSDIFLATKVNSRMSEKPNDVGNSRNNIVNQCEKSLKRLQTDYIDLYQLHRPSNYIAIDETLKALDDLIRDGKIRYIGSSNFGSWQVVESLWASEKYGLNRFVSEQSPFNLADRRAEREHIPMCQTYDLAFIPWSPLGGGGLTGKYLRNSKQATGTRFGDETDQKKIKRFNLEVLNITDGLSKIADEKNCSVAQVALCWVMSQVGVTAPIIGPRTMEQFDDNIGAIDINLTKDEISIINNLASPGSNTADFYEASFAPNLFRP
tara:strand:+ start:3746 stop:4750 length:1005 start_codon:yes stop_codon:yes gene_type:complete